MSVDLKTSLLVSRQVPEFVRDEYPKFITFLEAYYEFLETQANTSITSNNLVTTAKTLKNIRDVDDSLERFERNFYNTYASLIPLEVQANKALLFKHLTNLYKSKGSEGSFKLLFRLVFGEDVDIILPKNNVLRASASKWQVDNKLRINPDVSSRYIGNGTNKTFYFAQRVDKNEVSIFVDGILKLHGVDFFINREYRQLNFVTAPANNSIIVALYDNFDTSLIENRKVIGVSSGASAIIEKAIKRTVADTLNLGLPIELFINLKTLKGNFLNGEIVTISINDENNNISIDIRASTFSIVKRFNIISSGNNYSVGDVVSAVGGNASSNAFGVVESIKTAFVDVINVNHGGAVFSLFSPISVTGNNPLTSMTVVIDGIDTSGTNAANTFLVSPDIISNVALNVGGPVYINTSNFGAVFSKGNISAANTISDALNYLRLQAGPITSVNVVTTTVPLTEKGQVVFDAAGLQYGSSVPFRYSKSLKSIARYKINNGGLNYRVGDEIIFGPNPIGTYGQHAAAVVAAVNSAGAIIRVDSANSRIRGTASINTACNELNGTQTFFTQDLKVGDIVEVNTQSRVVSSITNDTLAVMTSTWAYTSLNRKVGVYNRWPLGGYGYVQNNFPSITVSSATGSNANVQIDSLAGDGERLEGTGFSANGQITSIRLVDPGSGYEFIPKAFISGGDGTATATAEIERSFISTQGRWTTSDSIISSFERKIQGEDYYVDYSYVISSQIEFTKYKTLLKRLLHPVGLINYAVLDKQTVVELTDVAVQDTIVERTISGTVNVGNGMVTVTGVGTRFNVANARGILSVGSSIAVNGELKKISSIVNDTKLIISSNISNLKIASAGSGYSNGYLVFSNGGGQVTSLTLTNKGSGYDNGSINFIGTDEAIAAVANIEVFSSNGAIRSISLISGGLYSSLPIATPNNNPHRVLYANGISMTNPGQGYSNGWLVFSGGDPLRQANVRVIVHPNTVINTFVVNDSGLYQTNPTVSLNTNSNVVIATAVVATGVRTITANAGARAVNSFVTFYSDVDSAYLEANARIYVNTAGYVQNVEVRSNGAYANANLTANIASLRFYENNQVYNATTNSLANVVLTIGVSNKGNGHTNGIFTLSGSSSRDAVVRVETFPPNTSQVVSIIANTNAHGVNGFIVFSGGGADNIGANARIYVNSTGAIVNVTVLNRGLYRSSSKPIARANSGSFSNAEFTLTTLSMDGQIRKITIEDPGLYFSTPTATLNNSPNSVISITSNTAGNTFAGVSLANGRFVFSGGVAVRDAIVTYNVFPTNGVIDMRTITVVDAGLYRIPPSNVSPNITPVSITEVRPTIGGSGYVNGNLVFSTTQATANIVANCTVEVNGAFGAIVRTTMQHVGLYANGADIVVIGVLNPATAALQSPSTIASFSIGFNANTRNIANLAVTTSANLSQSAIVFVTANSNNYTNAAITATTVANDQTNAVITVGFTEQNTAANVLVEVHPVKVNAITANAGSKAVNSFISLYTDNGTEMESANARVYVNTAGYVVNVVVSSNGSYSKPPIANIAGLRYVENNQVFDATTNSQVNVAFTIVTTGNGAIRKLTLNTQSILGGEGSYYYIPDVTPNSGGTGAVITFNPTSWYQTANAQSAIIISSQPSIRVTTENDNIVVTEQGKDVLIE